MLKSVRYFAAAVAMISTTVGYASAQNDPIPSEVLAEPDVIIDADPEPPFIYWAPEGSTIRNHPHDPMIWIAESADGSRKYYFGDQCRASQFQGFVGEPLDSLPKKPADVTWRMACSTCAVTSDLGRERMNVFFDENSRIISSISCG